MKEDLPEQGAPIIATLRQIFFSILGIVENFSDFIR
jgi:hypothetical protein